MTPQRRRLLSLLAVLGLVSMLALLAGALRAALGMRAGRERFEEAQEAQEAPEVKTVKEDVTKAGARVQVVDTGRPELGKCLVINGKVQLCDREEARYHELLVHFPCAYLPDGPKRVLIVGGADCMALREVLKYASVEAVVVVEPDEQLTSLCEQQFMTSRQTKDPRVRFLFGPPGETVRRLHTPEQLQTYDLAIVDTKERPGLASTSDARFVSDVHLLLRDRGVMVKNGDGAEAVLKRSFTHVLVFGFQSEAHVKHYKMAVAGDFDLGSHPVDADAIAERHSKAPLSFYAPDRHLTYVPWFSALKKAGVNAAASASAAAPA